MGLIKNAVVFAGGYVVGSRAGRARYEQLKQQATELLQRPEVQQARQRAQEAITQKLPGRANASSKPTPPQGKNARPLSPRAWRRADRDNPSQWQTEADAATGLATEDATLPVDETPIDPITGTESTPPPRLP